MITKQVIWVHGTSIETETPKSVRRIQRTASFTRITGIQGGGCWVHFAIPTPVMLDNARLKIESVMVRFRSHSTAAYIARLHVCDGEECFLTRDNVCISSPNWNTPSHQELVRPARTVLWGIGVSLYLVFNGDQSTDNIIELAGAGCEFLQ